jgi:hypothetical protein
MGETITEGGPGDPYRGRGSGAVAGASPGVGAGNGGPSWPPGDDGKSEEMEGTAGGARRRRWRRTSCHRLPQTWCRPPRPPQPPRAAGAAADPCRRRPTTGRRRPSGPSSELRPLSPSSADPLLGLPSPPPPP